MKTNNLQIGKVYLFEGGYYLEVKQVEGIHVWTDFCINPEFNLLRTYGFLTKTPIRELTQNEYNWFMECKRVNKILPYHSNYSKFKSETINKKLIKPFSIKGNL